MGGHKVRARQYPWGTVEGELLKYILVCGTIFVHVCDLLLYVCDVVSCSCLQLRMRLIATLSSFVRCCSGTLKTNNLHVLSSSTISLYPSYLFIPPNAVSLLLYCSLCYCASTSQLLCFFCLSTNMEDLREKTHSQHYELFRRNRLQQMGFADKTADNRPVSLQETYEIKRQQHLRDMQTKEERMRQMFVQKVRHLFFVHLICSQ